MNTDAEQFVEGFQTFIERSLVLPYKQQLDSLIDLAGYRVRAPIQPDDLFEFFLNNMNEIQIAYKHKKPETASESKKKSRAPTDKRMSTRLLNTKELANSASLSEHSINLARLDEVMNESSSDSESSYDSRSNADYERTRRKEIERFDSEDDETAKNAEDIHELKNGLDGIEAIMENFDFNNQNIVENELVPANQITPQKRKSESRSQPLNAKSNFSKTPHSVLNKIDESSKQETKLESKNGENFLEEPQYKQISSNNETNNGGSDSERKSHESEEIDQIITSRLKELSQINAYRSILKVSNNDGSRLSNAQLIEMAGDHLKRSTIVDFLNPQKVGLGKSMHLGIRSNPDLFIKDLETSGLAKHKDMANSNTYSLQKLSRSAQTKQDMSSSLHNNSVDKSKNSMTMKENAKLPSQKEEAQRNSDKLLTPESAVKNQLVTKLSSLDEEATNNEAEGRGIALSKMVHTILEVNETVDLEKSISQKLNSNAEKLERDDLTLSSLSNIGDFSENVMNKLGSSSNYVSPKEVSDLKRQKISLQQITTRSPRASQKPTNGFYSSQLSAPNSRTHRESERRSKFRFELDLEPEGQKYNEQGENLSSNNGKDFSSEKSNNKDSGYRRRAFKKHTRSVSEFKLTRQNRRTSSCVNVGEDQSDAEVSASKIEQKINKAKPNMPEVIHETEDENLQATNELRLTGIGNINDGNNAGAKIEEPKCFINNKGALIFGNEAVDSMIKEENENSGYKDASYDMGKLGADIEIKLLPPSEVYKDNSESESFFSSQKKEDAFRDNEVGKSAFSKITIDQTRNISISREDITKFDDGLRQSENKIDDALAPSQQVDIKESKTETLSEEVEERKNTVEKKSNSELMNVPNKAVEKRNGNKLDDVDQRNVIKMSAPNNDQYKNNELLNEGEKEKTRHEGTIEQGDRGKGRIVNEKHLEHETNNNSLLNKSIRDASPQQVPLTPRSDHKQEQTRQNEENKQEKVSLIPPHSLNDDAESIVENRVLVEKTASKRSGKQTETNEEKSDASEEKDQAFEQGDKQISGHSSDENRELSIRQLVQHGDIIESPDTSKDSQSIDHGEIHIFNGDPAETNKHAEPNALDGKDLHSQVNIDVEKNNIKLAVGDTQHEINPQIENPIKAKLKIQERSLETNKFQQSNSKHENPFVDFVKENVIEKETPFNQPLKPKNEENQQASNKPSPNGKKISFVGLKNDDVPRVYDDNSRDLDHSGDQRGNEKTDVLDLKNHNENGQETQHSSPSEIKMPESQRTPQKSHETVSQTTIAENQLGSANIKHQQFDETQNQSPINNLHVPHTPSQPQIGSPNSDVDSVVESIPSNIKKMNASSQQLISRIQLDAVTNRNDKTQEAQTKDMSPEIKVSACADQEKEQNDISTVKNANRGSKNKIKKLGKFKIRSSTNCQKFGNLTETPRVVGRNADLLTDCGTELEQAIDKKQDEACRVGETIQRKQSCKMGKVVQIISKSSKGRENEITEVNTRRTVDKEKKHNDAQKTNPSHNNFIKRAQQQIKPLKEQPRPQPLIQKVEAQLPESPYRRLKASNDRLLPRIVDSKDVIQKANMSHMHFHVPKKTSQFNERSSQQHKPLNKSLYGQFAKSRVKERLKSSIKENKDVHAFLRSESVANFSPYHLENTNQFLRKAYQVELVELENNLAKTGLSFSNKFKMRVLPKISNN